MSRALRRLRRRADDGAAAVEFALLLPIFILILFGTIEFGFALWDKITITQAGRDAARYGSTLPLCNPTSCPAGLYKIDDWLSAVQRVALESGGWKTDGSDVTSNGGGYVCVAYVTDTGNVTTKSLTVGTAPSGAYVPASSSAPCIDPTGDNLVVSSTDYGPPRAQVVIHRHNTVNIIITSPSFTMNTSAFIPYERSVP